MRLLSHLKADSAIYPIALSSLPATTKLVQRPVVPGKSLRDLPFGSHVV